MMHVGSINDKSIGTYNSNTIYHMVHKETFMKRFSKRSDLIKHAIRNVEKRQADERKEHESLIFKAGDFLQQCAMKLRLPR